MRILIVFAILLVGFVCTAQGQHEYAPLQEKEINYENWTYRDVRTNEPVNLRDFVIDKKIVLVFYFAAWCHSSQYESPVLQGLYEKYKDQGLGIIGVSLYSSIEDINLELDKKKITFPVVSESTSKRDRVKSLHYNYRTQTGDDRKWGTPWNIFLTPSGIEKKGDILVRKAFVANGELVTEEGEKLIREQLGLPAEDNSAKKPQGVSDALEPCEDTKELIKP